MTFETGGYPRPQLRRDNWLSLDGQWEFALDPQAQWTRPDSVAWTQTIRVPFAWADTTRMPPSQCAVTGSSSWSPNSGWRCSNAATRRTAAPTSAVFMAVLPACCEASSDCGRLVPQRKGKREFRTAAWTIGQQ